MRTFAVFAAAAALCACSTPGNSPAPAASDLLGIWQVDLRPTPGAQPQFQELVVTAVHGKAFTGRFYGAPITQGRINTDWGTLRVAFVTADGSGAYHHSAVLTGPRLEGLTNATGRDFLAYWSATRR